MKEDLAMWGKRTMQLLSAPLKFLFVDAPRWANCNVAHRRYWVIIGYMPEDDELQCMKCGRTFYHLPYSNYPEKEVK